MPRVKGGSRASDAVMAGLPCNFPIGGRNKKQQRGGSSSSCAAPANNLLDNFVSLTPATVPMNAASPSMSGLHGQDIPASTLGVLNAELSSFGILPNTFNNTPIPFTPPLLVGAGGAAHCKFCAIVQKAMTSKRMTKPKKPT
jgi:hypothetical protein